MSTLLGFLFTIALCALVVGLYKPVLLRLTSRKQVWLYCGGALLVLGIITGIADPSTTPTPEPETAPAVANQSASSAPATSAPVASQPTETQTAPTPPKSSDTPPAPTQPSAAKSWHTVATLSGDGQKTTAPFTIQGSEWRVDWKTSGQYNFQIYTNRVDGNLTSCEGMANIIGNGSDTSYCYESGQFYFMVNTGNTWAITVEDYY